MTIFQPQGSLTAQHTNLSSGAATTVLSAQTNGAWVDSIRVVNTTAGAVNITVDKYDGSTAYDLVTVHPLPARGGISAEKPTSVLVIDEPFFIEKTWTVRVTGASGIAVHVNYLPPAGRTA